jgi:hypothetical protein
LQVIRPFNLSPSNVGLIYGLRDGANSLFSPFWGWLCDRVPASIHNYVLFKFCFPFIGVRPINWTIPEEIYQTLLTNKKQGNLD